MKNYNKTWNTSKKPSKQRKYRDNAPLHTKKNLLSIHLSKELIAKHKKRSIPVRKGDKVKVMRGTFKAKTGLVEQVDHKLLKILVKGIEVSKKDGSKSMVALNPSNLMLLEPAEDKKRKLTREVK